MNALVPSENTARFAAPRLPWHPMIEERFGEIGATKASWKALTEAVYPNAQTADSIVMALSYCAARKLDPFKRPVHIVPMWDSSRRQMVETVWPGISEIRTTAFRTGQYAGCDEVEFGPMLTRTFKGMVGRRGSEQEKTVEVTFPEWGRINVYRTLNGQRCKFVSPKVYWLESYGRLGASDVPNDMWAKRPSGQLEKCVEAAGLRKAFPEEVGNDYSAEEMHGQVIVADVPSARAESLPPPPPPPLAVESRPQEPVPPAPPVEDAVIVDEAAAASTPAPEAAPAPKGEATEGETFDAEAWLAEAESVFAGCKAESDVDEAHAMFEDTAENDLSRDHRERYQAFHVAALERVAPPKEQKPVAAPPAPPSDDEDDRFPGDEAIRQAQQQGGPAPEDDPTPGEIYIGRLRDALLDPNRTVASLTAFWNDTLAERKALVSAGEISATKRDGLRDDLSKEMDRLRETEQPAPPAPPAPPAETGSAEDFDREFTSRLAEMKSATEVNAYSADTLERRKSFGEDHPLFAKWRKDVVSRRNTLNGL